MNFDYDIFISFAQSDKTGVDIEWSLKFCNLIDNMLNKMTNEKPVIITSADIEARVNMFHISRKEIYSKSAIFVVILSEESLNDQEFISEMNEFSEYLEMQKDGMIEKSMRVFKIMSSPVLFNKLPDFLRFETSFNFYETNLVNGRTQIFDLSYDSKKDNVFWSRLVDLSYDIAEGIHTLKTENQISLKVDKPTVYIATTTPDQEECRDIIRRDLKQLGYKVVPDFELPEKSKAFKEIVFDLIQKSSFSIHIMGAYYGKYLEEMPFSAVEFQNKIVAEYINILPDNEPFERYIWISSDIKIRDQKQRLYIGRLKRDDSIKSSEIIECPLEDMKSIIDNKLYNPNKENEIHDKKILFFQYPESENEKIKSVMDEINGMPVELVTSGMLEQKDILQIYWDKLLEADILMFYYNGNDYWLDFKIKDAIKVRGYKSDGKDLNVLVISDKEKTPEYESVRGYSVVKLMDVKNKIIQFLS